MRTICNTPLKSNGIKRIILILLVIVLTVGFVPAVNGSYADAYSGNVGYAGGYFSYDNANYMLTLVNEQRELYGLSALDMDYEMLDAAMIRAFECTQYFSHYRPDGSDPSSLCSKIYSENISWGRDAAGTMSGWMASAPHRGNILDPDYKSIGIGSFITSGGSPYWVLVFSYESAYNITWEYDGEGWNCYENGTKVKSKWINDGGEWYYIKSDGYMASNEWTKDSKGWMWMNSSGRISKSKWIKYKNEWYYLKSDGYMAADEWAKDSHGWMWMNSSGKISKSKWIKYEGEWYYLRADGYKAANEWAKDSKGWMWLDSDGKILKSSWIEDKGDFYYLKDDGYMAHDEWLEDDKGMRWLLTGGRVARSRWIYIDNEWYYTDSEGYKVTNAWASDSYGTCRLDENGMIMTDQWIELEDGRYYVGNDGYMVTGAQIIGGKSYLFDESGKLIEKP